MEMTVTLKKLIEKQCHEKICIGSWLKCTKKKSYSQSNLKNNFTAYM